MIQNEQKQTVPYISSQRNPNGSKMNLQGSLDCLQGAVRAVRYNVDGDYILTCGSNKTVKLLNAISLAQLKTYLGHGDEVLDTKSTCDNSQIVSCGQDKTVILWDVSTGVPQRKWRGHAGTVNCVALNEDSTVCISGSIDATVKCWDMRSKSQEPIQVMEEMKDSVTCLIVTDHEIMAGSADGKVRTYDLRNGRMITDMITYDGSAVTSISMTSDGQCYLVSTTKASDSIKLMDKTNGSMLQEYSGVPNTKGYRIECCVGFESRQVLSGSDNGHVLLYDLVKGDRVQDLKVNDNQVVHSLCYHPSKEQFACASKNKVFIFASS